MRAPGLVTVVDLPASPECLRQSLDVRQFATVWCLVRVHGRPVAIRFWDVSADEAVRREELVLPGDTGLVAAGTVPTTAGGSGEGPTLTVVVCTRNRASGLRCALESLRGQDETEFDVLVVDNAPSSAESETVTRQAGLSRCDYMVEPRPGLARARNAGLSRVRTDLVAWLDDDERADRGWIFRIREGFAHDSRPAAVCGVMLPAELESEAQVRFEQYGGFNKGRGIMPEVLRQGSEAVRNVMYPLPSFGSGGNMAYRTDALRAIGGFDAALGAGTRTHGGEETKALALLLRRGDTVLHWPAAITWHVHRRTMDELTQQFFGYSCGLSAFYVAMLRADPANAKDLARSVPLMLQELRSRSQADEETELPPDFPPALRRSGRRGLIEGAPRYVVQVLAPTGNG